LAVEAGVDVVELYGAQGYLLHQYMSPASNRREDEYGDPLRFPLEVVRAVRAAMPPSLPLMFRVSLREYGPGGYEVDHALALLPHFVAAGVDLFDVSTGGDSPTRPAVHPGYQLRYATMVREALALPVATVGMMHSPELAEYAVREERTDLVLIGRGLLRHPYWAHEAARRLGLAPRLRGEYDKGV